jgi:arylsulfatase
MRRCISWIVQERQEAKRQQNQGDNAMAQLRALIISLLAIAVAACGADNDAQPDPQSKTPPNILLIVADDLGYSDIASFGGEISTPVLDQLANEGLRFSNFHVLPTCSPTRAALMSGNDNHVAGMGVMSEFIYPEIAGLPGYVGHLADQVATIPEILRGASYHTYMAGKWHLGEADDQSPYAHGFEQTFTMMNGGGSHWADMRPLSPPQKMIYRRNGERVSSLPDDFYSSKDYTNALIEFIDSDNGDGKPFFAYLSFTAPHDPLHAPAEYIEKYRGMYDGGWDALAANRLASLKKLGLVPDHVEELPGNFMTSDWESLSIDDQRAHSRDMEVYAAMVEYMDMSIGRLFEYLQSNDLYDNTLIIFFSDNGANGAPATAYSGNADGSYLATFDNEIDNRGRASSFVDMGPNWAQASSAPLRLFKSFTSQGGIKSPMIAKLPGRMSSGGGWSDAFLHVTDVMPTMLEAAAVDFPEQLAGRSVRQPTGLSVMPVLLGEKEDVRGDEGIGYELFEMKAYIKQEMKILRLPEPFGTGEWQLYNLEEDPGEILDLSDQHPDLARQMIEEWMQYAETNEVYDHKGYFDELYRKAYGVN